MDKKFNSHELLLDYQRNYLCHDTLKFLEKIFYNHCLSLYDFNDVASPSLRRYHL